MFSAKDKEKLIEQLHRDEGTNPRNAAELGYHEAYLDSEGILTFGYGHNCKVAEVPGINKPGDRESHELACLLFDYDLSEHIRDVQIRLPWVRSLDGPRQAAVYNAAFNLGVFGFLGFKNAIASIKAGDYDAAASHMLNSKWASQVKQRAVRLAQQIRTGEWV